MLLILEKESGINLVNFLTHWVTRFGMPCFFAEEMAASPRSETCDICRVGSLPKAALEPGLQRGDTGDTLLP